MPSKRSPIRVGFQPIDLEELARRTVSSLDSIKSGGSDELNQTDLEAYEEVVQKVIREMTDSAKQFDSVVDNLRISICTWPGKINLAEEVKLLKGALLYGDSVQMMSPSASRALADLRNPDHDKSTGVEDLLAAANELNPDDFPRPFSEVIRRLKRLARKGHLTPRDRFFLHQVLLATRRETPARREFDLHMAAETGALDLASLVEAGLLELVDVDPSTPFGELLETIARSLYEAILFPSSLPIVDERYRGFIECGLQSESEDIAATSPSSNKQAALATSILDRLPTFPQLSIAQVIELRNDIGPSLPEFRAQMIRLSENIGAEPWTPEFGQEVQQIYYRDVVPAVAEIQAKAAEHSLVKRIIELLGAPAISGAAFNLVFASIPEVQRIATPIGVALGIYKELGAQKTKADALRRNSFYLCLAASTTPGTDVSVAIER